VDSYWWQLPGPARFVSAAVDAVRGGRNVLFRLPCHADHGLCKAAAERMREFESWRWRTLRAADLPAVSAIDIAHALHGALDCQTAAGELPSAAHLAQTLPDREVACVDGITAAEWPAWARFLDQYQHACQGRDEDRRALFCVPLVGPWPCEPSANTTLAVLRWEGVVGRLDTMLYLDRLLAGSGPDGLLRRVVLAVGTELVGSDPALAVAIAANYLDALDDPFPLLGDFARERGWSTQSAAGRSWASGVWEEFDGSGRVHSAALAAAGLSTDIARRVWQGQVAVLYPFIEEQRVQLLPEVAGLLPLPVETTYGRVEQAIDLELGQLVHFLRDRRVPQDVWRRLQRLRDARHQLAHLRPLRVQDLAAGDWIDGT
jgi:hypothetical protein